jgi:peptidoglycan biosynthesis protein MviN/MurJ (putative lipid II flippase)
LLTITLLLGSSAAAPSILALGYANCSNQGDLLVRTKAIQLALFVVLAVLLIPPMGPLGAAIAIVASDLLVQSGFMASVIISRTLRHPSRHVAFLVAIWLTVVGGGWVVGAVIGWLVPGTGAIHLVAECALWLIVIGLLVSPLAIKRVRNGLIAAVPR